MEKKNLIIRLFAVLAVMMCAQGANAAEAYACYTSSNTTLTFYYDNQRSNRTGTTYDLNTSQQAPGWYYKFISVVVFDPSFAGARPTTTCMWFCGQSTLKSINGMKQYLNTSEVTNMKWMFEDCTSLTSQDVSNFNTSKVTDMERMFRNCSGLTNLDLSGFNTSNVINMYAMFEGCTSLTSLNVSSFTTPKVTDMCSMFGGCTSLTSLDLSSFNTSRVSNMFAMFNGCSSLSRLDVSSFNTSKVTDMRAMFYGCTAMTTIYAGYGWSTDDVSSSNSSSMFSNCTSLVGGKGTTYNANHVDKTYAHIDGGPNNPGYFTDKNASLRGDVNDDGEVNIADVNAVINIILGGAGNLRADVNNDGEINIADVNAVIDIILNPAVIEEHKWVDLCLPSGTLWASCNIGADSPEQYGDYFAWGETEPKEYYYWNTYKWCNGSNDAMTKYCANSDYGFADGKTELDPEDDAAYVNWGPSWRVPSLEQIQELVNSCTWQWTQRNSVYGQLGTGPNGNTIFLPAEGDHWQEKLMNVGIWGAYWSRTLDSVRSDYAYELAFNNSGYMNNCANNPRCRGFAIRAVRVP